jgi:hypothetical protein
MSKFILVQSSARREDLEGRLFPLLYLSGLVYAEALRNGVSDSNAVA